jgi:long-chain acyl-CoA synthetase
MLTHRNFIANCQGSYQRIQFRDTDSVVSILPLSHIFERLAGFYFMAACGLTIAFAEGMATAAEDIRKVRPTVVMAVPRFFEKAHARIHETVARSSRWKQKLFEWAVRVGGEVSRIRISKAALPAGLLAWNWIAGVLVFNKIKRAFGGRIRFFISGGAPLSKDLAKFFHGAGMHILEGYGLTETSPVIAVNALEDCKFGTVGKPIPGVSVRIAEDGEILTSGPCVMKGYYKDPEATAEMIKGGWLYTGDIGYIDDDGFLHITDRKKDIIVTAGGKNVAPQNIEGRILSDCLFSQAVVLGDKKPYLCALIVLNREELLRTENERELSEPGYEELLKRPAVLDLVAGRLAKCLEGMAAYEQVRAFELLPKEFTVVAGELTPTLKVKRRVIMKKYQALIDELYRKTDAAWSAHSLKHHGRGHRYQ